MMVIATIIKPTSLFHEVRGWNAGLPISSKVTRGGGFESDIDTCEYRHLNTVLSNTVPQGAFRLP